MRSKSSTALQTFVSTVLLYAIQVAHFWKTEQQAKGIQQSAYRGGSRSATFQALPKQPVTNSPMQSKLNSPPAWPCERREASGHTVGHSHLEQRERERGSRHCPTAYARYLSKCAGTPECSWAGTNTGIQVMRLMLWSLYS